MCLYHTYHWSCCPGTAQPAPYYMNSKCEIASAPRKSRFKKNGKCRIVHRILDGADHDQPCPKCGQTASDTVEETTTRNATDVQESAEQDPTLSKATDSQDAQLDPRYEQLAWMVGKLIQQQEVLTRLNIKYGGS